MDKIVYAIKLCHGGGSGPFVITIAHLEISACTYVELAQFFNGCTRGSTAQHLLPDINVPCTRTSLRASTYLAQNRRLFVSLVCALDAQSIV
jgi:hypothetical protein